MHPGWVGMHHHVTPDISYDMFITFNSMSGRLGFSGSSIPGASPRPFGAGGVRHPCCAASPPCAPCCCPGSSCGIFIATWNLGCRCSPWSVAKLWNTLHFWKTYWEICFFWYLIVLSVMQRHIFQIYVHMYVYIIIYIYVYVYIYTYIHIYIYIVTTVNVYYISVYIYILTRTYISSNCNFSCKLRFT